MLLKSVSPTYVSDALFCVLRRKRMEENNKMKNEPVNKLMLQMGVPMILSMALQAVYNIVDSAFVGNMKEGSEANVIKLRDDEPSRYYCLDGIFI